MRKTVHNEWNMKGNIDDQIKGTFMLFYFQKPINDQQLNTYYLYEMFEIGIIQSKLNELSTYME